MDMSVSMDVSQTQEESMELTRERSGLGMRENGEMLGDPIAGGARQSVEGYSILAPPEYPHIKRRKIINSMYRFLSAAARAHVCRMPLQSPQSWTILWIQE